MKFATLGVLDQGLAATISFILRKATKYSYHTAIHVCVQLCVYIYIYVCVCARASYICLRYVVHNVFHVSYV